MTYTENSSEVQTLVSKGGEIMATTLGRLTFVVTKEMESLLADAKKNHFYDRTRSDMIRELVLAGLDSLNNKVPNESQSKAG